MAKKTKTRKYKLKTHKSTAKRFKVTGGGKVMRTKGGKSHLRRRKSSRAKRQLDRMQPVSKVDARRIRTMAPYLARYRANPPA
ncbi:MAG: 50S ribosomal protein L35 [Anaerolineaceae bacterium]|nr:50S ribosomal protein L35 [Anaerolineaceae bacterium]MDE0329094.1 50S ribosomal protein L35 [Anaerolineaceae bacterium]